MSPLYGHGDPHEGFYNVRMQFRRSVSLGVLPGVLLGVGVCASLLLVAASRPGQEPAPGAFAARIARLSEPAGFFDTDNLISNERSYLHVMPALRAAGLSGGAYIGVGPDQNFSYIAQVKPAIAFIVDIRRDNMLIHLLFKALFQLSTTRVEYLSLLLGRQGPAALDGWRQADLDRIVAHIDDAPAGSPSSVDALRARVDAAIRAFGVPLSRDDTATIDRFHRRFIAHGLSLKFETIGRGARTYYPTLRELLLETDREGRRGSFLAAEDAFQFVRGLEQRDLVIPVVGDLAGRRALAAIGALMTERGETLSAFYTSNVEFYLFNGGTFQAFVDNLSHLPHSGRSLIIRSVFSGGVGSLPYAVPGYGSASTVQPVDEVIRGSFRQYRELIR